MKKIIFRVLVLILTFDLAGATSLRTDISVAVNDGLAVQTAVLSDSRGGVFVEIPKNLVVTLAGDQSKFTGEILAPAVIPRPKKKPRARMRELATFEILADTAQALVFTDKFALMSEKSKRRAEVLTPEIFVGSRTPNVFIPINTEVGDPVLWQYEADSGNWVRRGGKITETAENDTLVFSATLNRTGIFSLFDEDPPPSYVPAFPIDQIEMALPAPDFPDENLELNSGQNAQIPPNVAENFQNPAVNFGTSPPVNPADFGGFPPSLPESEIPAIPDFVVPAIDGGENSGENLGEVPAISAENLDENSDENFVPAADENLIENDESLSQNLEDETELSQNTLNQNLPAPENAELPQSGFDSNENQPASSGFSIPAALVLAGLILGASFYVAFVGRKS